MKAPRGEPSGG